MIGTSSRRVGPLTCQRLAVTRFGYTLMTEQSGPRELVRDAAAAERAGFDFEVSSDHYSPWLEAQGHAPYAWATLGAVTQVTERVELMTYVTCPSMRYHPAVVAQKAATIQILSEGRFTLGLGAGREPERARRRTAMARSQRATRAAQRSHRHHHRALRRRPVRLSGPSLPGRLRAAMGPPGDPSAAGRGRIGRPFGRRVRLSRRPSHRRRARRRPDRVVAGRGRATGRTSRGGSGRSRSPGAPTATKRYAARTSSSAGSAAAGR